MNRRLLRIALCTTVAVILAAPASTQAPPHYGPPDLRLERALGEGGPGGDHVFDQIQGIGLSEDEELFVADYFNHSIRVFDRSGRLVREIGRRGHGPGEFQDFRAFGVRGNEVFVFDSGNRRVTTLTADGEVVREVTVTVMNPGRWELSSPWIPLRHDYFAVGRSVPAGSIGDRRPYDAEERLVLARADGEVVGTLASYHPGRLAYRFEEWPGLVNHVPGIELPPTGAWTISGDSLVAFVDGVRGRVELFGIDDTGARTVASADRRWQARPLPERRVAAAAMEPLRRRHQGARPGQFELYMPERLGRVERILLDGGTRVWLKEASLDLDWDPERARGGARTPARWRVMDPETGRLMATVDLPEGFRLEHVAGNRLLGVHRDEWDVQTVRVYRLR